MLHKSLLVQNAALCLGQLATGKCIKGTDHGLLYMRHGSCLYAAAAMSKEVATGVNVYQSGSDPHLKPDSEYPEWLWGLLDKPKNARQLRERAAELGGLQNLPAPEFRRLAKLERKERIKQNNAENRKR